MIEAEWLSSTDPAAMLAWCTRPEAVMGRVPTDTFANLAKLDRKLRLFACACCRAVWDGTPCERCGGTGCRESGYVKCGGPLEGIRDNRRTVNCPDCHGSGRIGGLTDPRSRRAVEVAEAFAEGWATDEERLAAMTGAFDVGAGNWPNCLAWESCRADEAPNPCRPAWRVPREFTAVQAALLRSIVGNPFRPVAACEICRKTGNKTCQQGFCRFRTPNVLSLAAAIQGGEKCSACWNTYLKQNCTLCFGLGRTPFVSDPAAWAVLGDALEEAGVTDLAILNHCRGLTPCRLPFCRGGYWKHSGDPNTYPTKCHECSGSGWRPALVPHVRGDWVIDLLTGKE